MNKKDLSKCTYLTVVSKEVVDLLAVLLPFCSPVTLNAQISFQLTSHIHR